MLTSKTIPIHDFARDSHDSIPFKFVSLGGLANYDFSEPHRHNYYEIFFFAKGGGEHHIDFKAYAIHDHSIHFISPGQVHQLKRSPESHGCIVLFSRDFVSQGVGEKYSLYNFPFLNNSQLPALATTQQDYYEFSHLLSQVQMESGTSGDVYSEIMRSYLKVILLKCLQFFEARYPTQSSKVASIFNIFREMVENEYREQRQPAYYASKLNVTEKKLNTMCKEHSGESVSDFIKNRVLLEAKRLLSNTDHNIKEIAYFLGFEDPSYFNRFFRANTGLTAGDFRKGK
jgi:AraC-like DNA-binding protein